MSLLKKIFLFSALILSQHANAKICVNATANYKMFGSVLRADVLKNPFIMGFEKEKFKDYKISYADNDTQLVNQIEYMTKNQCAVVLGLFTSQDCLVAGPILKRNKTIAVSSSCSDNKIIKFFPYVYTATPKLSDYSKKIAEYLNNSKSTELIYAFYQPSDVYSRAGFDAFKENINKPIINVPVNSSGIFNLKIPKDKISTLVFFTYPLPSAQILVSLDANHLITEKIHILGASSWIFDVSVFRPIKSIFQKSGSALTPALADQKRINASDFAHKFLNKFNREPDIVEVLTYDMTRLAVQCFRKIQSREAFNNTSFLKCLNQSKFKGVSGETSFDADSPFARKEIYLINLLRRI